MPDRYLEQWERVIRWYRRFEKINQGRKHDMPSENYKDEVYCFFMNCYHLKDWIKQDVTTLAQEVEDCVKNTFELSLCRDVCHAIKHLVLTQPTLTGGQPEFTKIDVNLALGGRTPTISVKYTIQTERGPVDAFNIAEKCVEKWKKFLTQRKLLPNKR